MKQGIRNIHYAATLIWVVITTSASAQYSLSECQEKAKANYPLIRQYDLLAKTTEYTVSNASKAFLPQVSITGIGGYIIKGLPSLSPGAESSNEKVQFIGIAQINQTIWDGGASHAQKDIAKASAAVEKANIDVAMYNLEERVNQLFFSMLLLDEQLNLLTILQDNLDRKVKAIKLSNENGLAFSSDVDEVSVEILKADQRKEELRFTRQGYAAMLAMLMGEQDHSSIQLIKPETLPMAESTDINRPELRYYALQRNQLITQDEIIKVGYMPKIGLLGAGIMIQPGFPFGQENLNSLAIAGLSLSWNTKSIYTASNHRELSRLAQDRVTNQQDVFLFNTNLQLLQQRSDIEKHQIILEKDNAIVALKARIKQAYELKYKNGMCTMNDLLLVTNSENEALSNRALHEIQLLMSMYTHRTTSGNK